MITAHGLTKRYGETTAVDDIDFTVAAGTVTGFLGPNGAGKSTTMRMIIGLDRPTAGSVTVNGRNYADLPAPLHEVGALLEAKAVHGGRSAYHHLLWLAQSHGIPRRRVDEVLATVGLTDVAHKRSGGFSLGMGQRLGIACALLGDPGVLLFDEPVNGLDPEGIRWVRTMIRALAAEGRTVFVSSHLMSEMALTADHLLVIGRGRILADTNMKQFIDENSSSHVVVRTPTPEQLSDVLVSSGFDVRPGESGLEVHGTTTDASGDVAGTAGVHLHELRAVHASLEDAFMRLTADAVQYHAGGLPAGTHAAEPSDAPIHDRAPADRLPAGA